MQYVRQKENCNCKNYKNIDEIPWAERAAAQVFWKDGKCFDNGKSFECECHKRWRLTERYNRLAEDVGLPSYEELLKLKYLGNGDSYKKLKALPEIIENNSLNGVLVFVSGQDGCQKTTSLAKLMHKLLINSFSVGYVNFAELIEKIVNKDPFVEELKEMDWLIVDDCFEGETINFRTAYTAFYNIILKRRNPTIISTSKTKMDLVSNQGAPSYNRDMLNRMFAKIDKYKTVIAFSDHVDKILAVGSEEKPIDIWSM